MQDMDNHAKGHSSRTVTLVPEETTSKPSQDISGPNYIIKEIMEVSKGKPTETPEGFHLGQIVWGKVKGHSWWPAYLTKVYPLDHHSKNHARVNFIGHESQYPC